MSHDKDVNNPRVPASGQTEGTSDGGKGTTSGEPENRSGAAAESDPTPYGGTRGGHSRGGEGYK